MHSIHKHFIRVLLAARLANCASVCNQILTSAIVQLSSNATIQCNTEPVRWSEYAAPRPGAIVTVGNEDDVAELVTFANDNSIEFLLQSGGNGWADTFAIGPDDFIIDISQLTAIEFNAARTEVTFQAGVVIRDLVNAAWANNARVATGTCNCVSVLGAALGGGLGRTSGLYGQGVDQLLSMTYINAVGQKTVITPQSDPDLWWAIAGAGPNFGIVTSVVFKSYPIPQTANTAWTGELIYDESQLESVISAIDELVLDPDMQLDFTFNAGAFVVLPFYIGTEEVAQQKFASLLDIGPVVTETSILSYDVWNSAGDSFCVDGGRKPTYGNNIDSVNATTWREIWNEYISFIELYPETNSSTILAECYSTTSRTNVSSLATSFPWRGFKCYVSTIAWYTDEALDEDANQFGRTVRAFLSSSSGYENFSTYINFAHGDEALSSVYGQSLSRLQELKQKYDPLKRFNQWFPLS